MISFYLARHTPTQHDLARTTLPALSRRITAANIRIRRLRLRHRRLRHQMQHDRAREFVMCVPAPLGRLEDVDRVPGAGRRC